MNTELNLFPAVGKQITNWISYEKNIGKTSKPNILSFLEFVPEIDLKAAEAALQRIVCKHESLRTTFTSNENTVYQSVEPYSVSKHRLLVSYCVSYEQWRLKKHLMTKRNNVLLRDLKNGPLFRLIIYMVQGKGVYISFDIHHILADDWSLKIIWKELMEEYMLAERRIEKNTEDNAQQLRSFAIAYIEKKEEKRVINYLLPKLESIWEDIQLQNLYTFFSMSSLSLRPSTNYVPKIKLTSLLLDQYINSAFGGSIMHSLEDPLVKQLQELAIQNKTMLPILFQSSLAILFKSLYDSQQLFIINRLNGRFSSGTDQLIGNLTCATYSILDLKEAYTWNDTISVVQNSFFNDIQYPVYNPQPLSKLNLARKCHVCINILRAGEEDAFQEFDAETSKGEIKAHFPLECTIVLGEKNAYIRWIYNAHLFRKSMIDFIITEHKKLLYNMCAQEEEVLVI